MSGHSKWATTHRQKAVVDAKRGAVFTKLGNMIAIAARGGIDPAMNPNLAMAIEKAKSSNMPLANIQRAIDRVADKNAAQLEEVVYEAYGPGGIGIVVEAATDNKNRTYPEIRTALTKNGGTMADGGSVLFQFNRKGVIRVADASGEEALLAVLDAGAEDAIEEDGGLTVYTEMKDLHAVRQAIVDAGLKVEDAELQYVASNEVAIDTEAERKLNKILDALDDVDDVINVHTNARFSE